jgi:hypothetical protein
LLCSDAPLCAAQRNFSAFSALKATSHLLLITQVAKKSFVAIVEAVMYLTDGKNFNAEDAENGRGGRREKLWTAVCGTVGKLWTAELRRTVGKLWTVVGSF